MANPGYYLSSPGELILLPRPPRWDSLIEAVEDKQIEHETEGGVLWIYPQFQRLIPAYNFRLPVDELAAFKALHLLVKGRALPFYFVPDTADMGTVYKVRKESGFKPSVVGPASNADGDLVQWYDYTLQLTAEIDALEIEA